jgi:hypothetical protein
MRSHNWRFIFSSEATSTCSIQNFTANPTALSTFGLLSKGTPERSVTIHSRSLKLQLLRASNLSVLGLFNCLQICPVDELIHVERMRKDYTNTQQQRIDFYYYVNT